MNIVKPNLVFNGNLVKRSRTDYIVLHHAAGNGTVHAAHNYHKDTTGRKGIAYNFYI